MAQRYVNSLEHFCNMKSVKNMIKIDTAITDFQYSKIKDSCGATEQQLKKQNEKREVRCP